jgi:peptidoglycan/LPS O-acetylase OafA/YrhL
LLRERIDQPSGTTQVRSKNISYDPRLDHLRALAAFSVLLFHAKLAIVERAPIDPFSIPLIDQGHIGVALFMVISGFIFGRIGDGGAIDIPKFYLSRGLRIFPLLIIVVLVAWYAHDERAVSLSWLVMPLGTGPAAEASAMWSVGLELQFYLIFPVLYPALTKAGSRAYLTLFALLLAIRTFVYLDAGTVHHFAFFSIFGALDAFLFGFIANKIAQRYTAPNWLPLAVLAIFMAAIAVLFHGHRFFHVDYGGSNLYWTSSSALWIIWPTLQGAFCAALVASYMACKMPLPGSGVIAWLGEISYSIYAWQFLVIFALMNTMAPPLHWVTPYLFGLIAAAVTVSFAALSYYVIERPFLERRVKYITTDAGVGPSSGALVQSAALFADRRQAS